MEGYTCLVCVIGRWFRYVSAVLSYLYLKVVTLSAPLHNQKLQWRQVLAPKAWHYTPSIMLGCVLFVLYVAYLEDWDPCDLLFDIFDACHIYICPGVTPNTNIYQSFIFTCIASKVWSVYVQKLLGDVTFVYYVR